MLNKNYDFVDNDETIYNPSTNITQTKQPAVHHILPVQPEQDICQGVYLPDVGGVQVCESCKYN